MDIYNKKKEQQLPSNKVELMTSVKLILNTKKKSRQSKL